MLQEFRVDNFKSLINIVFKPQGTNLLLGMNNSGKTNLCQALRFVSDTSRHSLDACADEFVVGRSGMTNFSLNKSTTDFYVRARIPHDTEELLTFEYKLTISPPQDRIRDTTVRLEREVLRVTGGEFWSGWSDDAKRKQIIAVLEDIRSPCSDRSVAHP